MMFFLSFEKFKKKKEKKKIKVCGELLFSSFILTNDITVQLLVSVAALGRERRVAVGLISSL